MWLLLKPKILILGMIVLGLGTVYGTHKVLVHKAVGKAVAETKATLQADYTKKLLEASELAREREQVMVSSADKIRKEKDAQIASLNSRLGTALDGLRQRPPRTPSSSQGSPDTCPGAGATGSSLSREDSEFLVREAARADRLRSALEQCYKQYDSVRQSVK
jgi:hypothetical protein